VRTAPDDAAAAQLVRDVVQPAAIATLERLYPESAAHALTRQPV
jgi:hypothetical protein